MSSFLVKDCSINKIVTFFVKCSYDNELYNSLINNKLKDNGYNLNYNQNDDNNPDAQRLIINMKGLNISAINYRYNEDVEKYDIIFNEIKENNELQILKTLQCFLYQCSEGNIPETKLFIMLKEIEEILKNKVIDKLDDYKKAKWE
jgi:hypothetical protein